VNHTYSMSFTSGTLLYRESVVTAEVHAQEENWETVRKKIVDGNLLQMRTANASARITCEVVSRLKLLTGEQLALLREGSYGEQVLLLWLAVCKRYRFIYDFAVQVLHEKFLRLDLTLSGEEYDIFFNRMAAWHAEVERVAPSTQAKQRQVVLKMLREADLLSADGQILPAICTPRLIAVIQADDPAHFALLPVSEYDIQRWNE